MPVLQHALRRAVLAARAPCAAKSAAHDAWREVCAFAACRCPCAVTVTAYGVKRIGYRLKRNAM